MSTNCWAHLYACFSVEGGQMGRWMQWSNYLGWAWKKKEKKKNLLESIVLTKRESMKFDVQRKVQPWNPKIGSEQWNSPLLNEFHRYGESCRTCPNTPSHSLPDNHFSLYFFFSSSLSLSTSLPHTISPILNSLLFLYLSSSPTLPPFSGRRRSCRSRLHEV